MERSASPAQRLVLIAEDEDLIARVLAMAVEEAGGIPVVAHDGAEALALARETAPALLITDLMMPRLNGLELIDQLREDPRSAVPVIMLSAAPPQQIRNTCADAVLSKPFDLAELLTLLDRYLAA